MAHLPAAFVLSAMMLVPLVGGAAPAGQSAFCDPYPPDTKYNDYRKRNSNAQLRWAYDDNMTNHIKPALDEMSHGRYWRQVIADISFTLSHWPNHLPALQALIEYDLAGGQKYEFRPTDCYFSRARQLFPDDVNVVMAQALWTWRKTNKELARSLYEEALRIDPRSAEAHYNLGLLLFEMSNYEESLDHARIAYEEGYPLPGLRQMLQRKGLWETDSTASDRDATRQ